MIKRIIALLLIFSVLLSGCSYSDYTEPENRTVVTAMLISSNASLYSVILETLNADDTENGEEYKTKYLVGEAENINKAVDNIQSEISNELSLYHCPLIICDAELYNLKQDEIFDYAVSNPQISLSAYLLLTDKIYDLIENEEESVFLGYEVTDMIELKDIDSNLINVLRGRANPPKITADSNNKFIFSEYSDVKK